MGKKIKHEDVPPPRPVGADEIYRKGQVRDPAMQAEWIRRREAWAQAWKNYVQTLGYDPRWPENHDKVAARNEVGDPVMEEYVRLLGYDPKKR